MTCFPIVDLNLILWLFHHFSFDWAKLLLYILQSRLFSCNWDILFHNCNFVLLTMSQWEYFLQLRIFLIIETIFPIIVTLYLTVCLMFLFKIHLMIQLFIFLLWGGIRGEKWKGWEWKRRRRERKKARKFESIMKVTYDAVAGSSWPIQTCNVRSVVLHTQYQDSQINTEIYCFSYKHTHTQYTHSVHVFGVCVFMLLWYFAFLSICSL